MPRVRVLMVLLGVCLSAAMPLAAQRSKLDCPRPARERRYHQPLKPTLDLGAGLVRPLMYHNSGTIGENLRFTSRLTPYVSALMYVPVAGRLEVYGGVSVMEVWQGLRFNVENAFSTFSINSFTGSVVATVPVGIRYAMGDRFRVSAGPYLAYASHSGQRESSATGGSGSSTSAYTYSSPDYNGFNFGLRLGAEVFFTKRISLTLSCLADALGSAPSYAAVNAGSGPGDVYGASLEPRLIHAGFGLSYRLFVPAD